MQDNNIDIEQHNKVTVWTLFLLITASCLSFTNSFPTQPIVSSSRSVRIDKSKGAMSFSPITLRASILDRSGSGKGEQHMVDKRYGDDVSIDLDRMKKEIEEMKLEAIQRIDAMSEKLDLNEGVEGNSISCLESSLSSDTYQDDAITSATKKEEKAGSNIQLIPVNDAARQKSDIDVLDNTQWKITLDVGREPGTWMPKTWGVSGERLYIRLELRFTPDQLYDREDFLGGIGYAKQCEVINQSVIVSPSMKEGSKTIPVTKMGGWRVGKGQGPLGSDLLRFYIELEGEVSHSGSDVYCPKGRVYCTCGFHAMDYVNNKYIFRSRGRRDALKQKQDEVAKKQYRIKQEIENEGQFSFKKIMLTRDLVQTSMDQNDLAARLNESKILEPDKSMLRFSKKGDVGVTKRGSVVCKVQKGYAGTEYHILGKLALASVEPRKEHEKSQK